MEHSTLNTFGAILSFAITLEGSAQEFYESAAAHDSNEEFADYARKAGKRKQRLSQIRQENVTEMVLEPITGLDATNYAITVSAPTSAGDARTQAIQLEDRLLRFYSDTSPKLNVTEARRAFQKFAQETADRIDALRANA
jgi:rubrerythrin